MAPEHSSEVEPTRGRDSRRHEETFGEDTQRLVERIRELDGIIEIMQTEMSDLRRKLNAASSDDAEAKLYDATRDLVKLHRRNRELTATLQEAREQLELLREKVEKLSAPPNNYGAYLNQNDDGTANINLLGKKMRVNLDPSIDVDDLYKGQEVIVNGAYNVVSVAPTDRQGEVVKVKDVLDETRALVTMRADEERVVEIAGALADGPLKSGDSVLLNSQTGMLIDKLPKVEADDLLLEEVPDVEYSKIGGLDDQIEQIRDAVELPYLYPEHFKEFDLSPPKGILLYGPPGCGKTLIAKAVANSIALKARELSGDANIRAFFINIKGPELLNKYVGETERKIREVFSRAREKAQEGMPVVIFFDEMDSLFRTRGLGISSDMESTLVPQFLAEIDGVEDLRNVIVIGASNRQDLLDPAVLRPGRLDVKIKIGRPDQAEARSIFAIYLTADLPIAEAEIQADEGKEEAVERLLDRAAEAMYSTEDENQFLELTYSRGEREVLYFKDFSSGAMVMNIVSRAKKYALKRLIDGGDKGLCMDDVTGAIRDEFKENEDLPNTKNPDEWASISGRKGERIVNVKMLVQAEEEEKKREVRTVAPGQYL
ncbi:proteasome ATPase [Candidatus Poribacteria bacterium]|jgi:proteasome-associated ATPase|nr:proteasome ATPase [Candidatus Poribacteria bacterium]MBT5536600.1 proteasome ATPase [Candidatus Poribacteria bacterium]MBT5713143.1 proteasome ATPase [Candidatus Poribacteria bacterium]MBT7099064.1 proteasome ATPase [Candidatus Poribacteria bacterium]